MAVAPIGPAPWLYARTRAGKLAKSVPRQWWPTIGKTERARTRAPRLWRRSALGDPVQSALRRDQMRTKPLFSVSTSEANTGAGKLGSSSLTERYSRSAVEVRFQAAPKSLWAAKMRKSGALSFSFSVGVIFALTLSVTVLSDPV